MLFKDTAIVLKALKYGENKVIVDFLTAEAGRVACVVTLSRSPRGLLHRRLFQPMTMLDIEYDRRNTAQQLNKLKNAQMAAHYASVTSEPHKLAIALFVSEFLYHATRGEQHNPNLFGFVKMSMMWLDGCEAAFANFHLVFMIHLTRFVGFFPNTDDYVAGSCFDLRQACFSRAIPPHADHVDGEEARSVLTLMRMRYGNMRLFRMSRNDRNRIADVILRFYVLHVPGFPELRSFQVLKELWQ